MRLEQEIGVPDGGSMTAQSVSAEQIIYLDFDGGQTAYNGEILTVDSVTVEDSCLTAGRIAQIIQTLNERFAGQNVQFVSEKPEFSVYSTIYIGKTSSFESYGSFAGLAETVDSGNRIRNDKAFVMLDFLSSDDRIADVIAHEAGHILGTLDHGGDGLARYAQTYIVSRGVTSTGVVLNSYDYMSVSSGGTANGTTVNSRGCLKIYSNGVANSTTINSRGSQLVLSGGMANCNTVKSGGNMRVSSGGTANSTTVDSDGSLIIFDGGAVSAATISSGGKLTVTSKGSALDVKENGGYVSYGQGANVTFLSNSFSGLELNPDQSATVHSGTTATGTTVNSGGCLFVYSGGVASSAAVNSGGCLLVNGEGRGLNIRENGGYVSYGQGANITFLPNSFSGLVLNSNQSATVHSMTAANDTVISSGGCLDVYNGGTASGITVDFSGVLHVYSGGTAHSIRENGGYVDYSEGANIEFLSNSFSGLVLNSNQSATVHSGTTAGSTFVSSCGTLAVYSGGTANHTTIKSEGREYVYNGGTVNSTIVSPGGFLAVYSSGTANNTTVNSKGEMHIFSCGMANNTTVNSKGEMHIFSCGMANGTTVNSDGQLYVSGGGTAENTTVNSCGNLFVCSSGTANSTAVSSGGCLVVSRGGTALAITENGGVVSFDENANVTFASNSFSGLALMYKQSATVHSGTTANSTTVDSGGKLDVFSGGIVNSTAVNIGGCLSVSSGGSASFIKENGGYVSVGNSANVTFASNNISGLTLTNGQSATIHSGTTANCTAVSSGCKLEVFSGGVISGTLQIESGAVVSAYKGAVIDFTVAEQTDRSKALINDWSLISGRYDVSHTITVREDQASGSYVLAGGTAYYFAKNVTVKTADKTLGTLSAGEVKVFGENNYTLANNSGTLTLTITSAIPVEGDLDGNGLADVIMTHDNGSTGAWLIQNDQTPVWGNLSTRSEGTVILGTGRTSAGKATADVYIRTSENIVGAWVTDSQGKVSGWETVGQFDSETQVLGIGDFNGDAQSDLLLRNNNGAVGFCFTSGEETGWSYIQSLGDEWTVSAIGDLNGDGMDDIVLKHAAGFSGTWLTQEDGTVKWAELDTLQNGFEIAGCGDFNGDGTDDVLLQKGSYFGAWIVKDGRISGWMGLGETAGSVEQIADFNGDGTDDLRIRTSDGDIGTLLVKGADDIEWKYYGSAGSEWNTSLAAL